MDSNMLCARLGWSAMISGLLLLSACGGGGSSPPVSLPAPAPQPAPAPAPTPAPEEVTLASTYTDLGVGADIGQNNWPDGSGTGAPIAGVDCITNTVSHTHSLVSIYRDGVHLAVPALVGLKGCSYEIHTHDHSSVVHVEPNVVRTFTLAQFFAVWNQPLSRTAVAGLSGPVSFYVIENETLTRFDGDPADLTFAPHKEIVIISGTPPAILPRYRWPAGL